MTAHPAPSTALVLGGGGSTGNAWLIGVVAGLFEAGLDVSDADLTVGTSAGATVAAQLAGATPTELLAAALVPPPTRTGGGPGRPVSDHLQRLRDLIAGSQDAADMRRRLGAAALATDSDASWSVQWRDSVAARLPRPDWPQRRLLLTALDARTGEGFTFDRNSGADLVDAVAASCSSRLPYRIGEDRYLDGGYRRNENADLAAGYDRVLVLSPLGGSTLHPPAWGMQLAAQVEELEAGGSHVETVVPDVEHEHLFGANAMDLSLRPAAARAGAARGRDLVHRLGASWAQRGTR
ncbi:patatin-like phospholipase family protein [Kineococcus sp. R86509]|uniref:patatin-like phospholipase family protein n=1 Tax=Kineococcus sp. R86509 TaxID=3093851 RepID=UPI0036D437D1